MVGKKRKSRAPICLPDTYRGGVPSAGLEEPIQVPTSPRPVGFSQIAACNLTLAPVCIFAWNIPTGFLSGRA